MSTQQDDQISNMGNALQQPFSVGKALREAREELGLSVNDVANRIKFAPRQIESLEADDYVHLPEAAFVRGFVRSYARLLELDATRLLSSLPSSHVQASSAQEVKSVDIPLPTAFSARRHNIVWLAAALVVALSLAIFERLHDRVPEAAEPVAETTVKSTAAESTVAENTTTHVEPLELPNQTAESEAVPLPEQAKPVVPVPQPAARTDPVVAPVSKPAVQTAPVAAPAPKPAVRAVPVPAPQPAPRAAPVPAPATRQAEPPKAARSATVPFPWQPVPQKSARVAPAVTGAPAPASEEPKINSEINSSEHKLRLELDEDAWVEVKDGSDKILISKMQSKGSLVRVTGKAPLLVIVGNARAVRLFDNGKKINLERYTSAEVARVKLK